MSAAASLARRPRTETDGAAAASAAGSAGAAAAAGAGQGGALQNARVLDLRNPGTKHNELNKWAQFLYLSNQYAGPRILTFLDPRSGDACALTCKHWNVLRTSNAISRAWIAAHFGIQFAPKQGAQKVEGTYWNRCRAYTETYHTCQRLAYQTPIPSIDFSAPSTPDSQGSFATALPSDPNVDCKSCAVPFTAIEMAVAMASYTTRRPAAAANPPANPPPPVYDSHLQIRTSSNICLFQGTHEGKVLTMHLSPSFNILAMVMEEGPIVLWDIAGRCKMGVLPHTHPSILSLVPSSAPADTAVEPAAPAAQAAAAVAAPAPPTQPKKYVKIQFLSQEQISVIYQNVVNCVWTYTWEPATKTFACQPACSSLARYEITGSLCSPDKAVTILHAENKQSPGQFILLVYEGKKRRLTVPIGQLKMTAWTFLSDRKIALAFNHPTNSTLSTVETLDFTDFENSPLQQLISASYKILNMAVGVGGKVLFMSCYHMKGQPQQLESTISLFDLVTVDFIRHQENGSPWLIPAIVDDYVLVRTVPNLPAFIAICRSLRRVVNIISFMPKALEAHFLSNTTVPLTQKPSESPAAAAAGSAGPAVGHKRKALGDDKSPTD